MKLKDLPLASVLLSLFCVQSFATSVIIVSTQNGVIIGADGKVVGGPPNTMVKVRLLKKKLIVACAGTEQFKPVKPDGKPFYSFPIFVSEVDKSTSANISVRHLADKIEEKMSVAFAPFAAAVKAGQVAKEQIPLTADGYFVEYIVAGFEKGKPTAYRIASKIDWGSKTVQAPEKVSFEVNSGESRNLWVKGEGYRDAIMNVKSANGDQYKKLAARVPLEAPAIVGGDSLSLDGCSNLARALIGMEIEAEQKFVGLPITVVTVPAEGDGWVETYDTDATRPTTAPKSGQKQ